MRDCCSCWFCHAIRARALWTACVKSNGSILFTDPWMSGRNKWSFIFVTFRIDYTLLADFGLGFCIKLSLHGLLRCHSFRCSHFSCWGFFYILLTTIDTSRRPRLSFHLTYVTLSIASSKNSTSVWVSGLWWEWPRAMCEDEERKNSNQMTVKQMVLFNVSYIARVNFVFCRNSKNITVDHTHADRSNVSGEIERRKK